jgi:multidrug efflux system membrane fusion protein
MNKKNIRMAAFIVAGVMIWMLLGLFAPEEREFERPPAQKLTVLTSNSIAQDYSLPITSKSESEAFSKIDLKSQTSEKIVKVNFKDGDFVKKGDIVCQLDSGQREANFKRRDIEYQSQK